MTITVQLFDLQLQVSNQRLVVGLLGANAGEFGARRQQRRLQRFNILRQFLGTVTHSVMESQRPRFGAVFLQSHGTIAQPIRRSAAASCVEGYASRSPPANSPSELRSAIPRRPPSPAK